MNPMAEEEKEETSYARYDTYLSKATPGDVAYAPRFYVLYDQIYEDSIEKKTYGCYPAFVENEHIIHNEYILVVARLHDDFNNAYLYVMTAHGDRGWIKVQLLKFF